MSIQPPPLLCRPRTRLISSGSSTPLSFPVLLHISFKQVLLEDSNLEQSNIVQGSILYSGSVETDENTTFGIILYHIEKYSRHIFLIHLGYSCYIPSTFEVHSRYSSCIFWIIGDARTVFGSHSASILTAFVQHSRHLPTGLQALFGQQSNCSRIWHSKCILNIMTAF